MPPARAGLPAPSAGAGRCAAILPRMATVIDVHTHFIPTEILDYFASADGPDAVGVEEREGRDPLVVHSNGLRYPVFPLFHDPAAKLEQMDRDGIDRALVSIVPTLFLYDLE